VLYGSLEARAIARSGHALLLQVPAVGRNAGKCRVCRSHEHAVSQRTICFAPSAAPHMSSGTSAQRPTPTLTTQAGSLLFAKIIAFVLSIAAPLVVIRVLDPKDFGVYKQVGLVLGTAIPLLSLSFYMNVFYFLPRRPAQGQQIVLNLLFVQCIAGVSACLLVIALPQVLQFLVGDELVRYASLIGVLLMVTMPAYVLEVVPTANQDVRYSTGFIISAQLSRSVVMVVAAFAAGTVAGLLWAMIMQAGLQCIVLFWYLTKRFPGFLRRPDWPLLKEQANYAVPLGISLFGYVLLTNLHLFAVARQVPAAQYAIYAVGCMQVPLIGMVWESVNAVLIPRISCLQQEGRPGKIILVLSKAVRKLSFVYWPAMVFFMVAGYQFIEILYTSQYAASWPIFLLNVAALPLGLLITDPVVRAYPEHIRSFLRLRFTSVAIMAIAVWQATALFGMLGAILSCNGVIAAERFFVVSRLARILGTTRKDLSLFRDAGKTALCALLAGLVVSMVRPFLIQSSPILTFVCIGVLYAATYVGLLFVFAVPTESEVAAVRQKFLGVRRIVAVRV
jgi:O-antigen/teichoic acid export membrane protein